MYVNIITVNALVKNSGIGGNDDYYRGNKSLPTADVQFEWTPEMVSEIKKCSKNILHFAENYFWAVTVEEGKKKLDLYKPQKKLLAKLKDDRFVITLASRQVGKTTTMTIFSLWMTCFQQDKKVLIVANREDTAKEILRRIKFAYEMLPNWLKPGVEAWGQTEVYFSNGSSISISATSSTAARGMSINVLIIDEMAFIPDHIMDEFWNSVIPIISSAKTTKVFAVSTPNGTGNLFYKIYTEAERGELKLWTPFRIDWWEIPGRNKKWKETMEEVLAKQSKSFAQEFGNQFIESGETATDVEIIEKFRKLSKDPLYTYDDGHYKIWYNPEPNHIYTIGVDVSEGVGGCASVAMVFDITELSDIKQVAVYHNAGIDPYHFAEFLNKMGNQWGLPPLLIERNGPGGQVIDALKEVHRYYNIAEYGAPVQRKSNNRLGIFSHTNSKNKAIVNMRYWINSLQVVSVYDLATVHEMETFIRYPNGTWKKKPGNYIFDDRVHAMLWSLFILDEDMVSNYFEIVEYDSRGKPLKINPLEIAPTEYFKLDPYYNDNDSALPIHFNEFENDSNTNMDDLFANGWVEWSKM